MSANQSEKPLLAITLGDPAGIGPEVIVGAWKSAEVHELARLFAVGHPEIMRRAVGLLKRDIEVVSVDNVESLQSLIPSAKTLPCLWEHGDDVLNCPMGVVDAQGGEAAFQAVVTAARLALDQRIDGLVTAPLSKAALHAAGHHYPGHTELLAELCGVSDFGMMLYLSEEQGAGSKEREKEGEPHLFTARSSKLQTSSLAIVHVTLHQSLRSIFADLTVPAIVSRCYLIDGIMRRLGVPRPRIAVCALNPHAGEDGLFGDEEQTIITPAVQIAKAAGLDIAGPFPTDTLMVRARDGEFDAIVAMYHDQGHIAIKLMGMQAAVNITLGLPIVRTSVAHGTAFDRAWQGTAKPQSMIAAIKAAAKLARSRSGATP